MEDNLTVVRWMQKESSKRDIEAIKMIADGISREEVSRAKKYNSRTMATHIGIMLKIFGCTSIAHLVATFLRNKIID